MNGRATTPRSLASSDLTLKGSKILDNGTPR